MQAYVLHGIGDIQLEEIEKPRPGDREVIVQVKAVGICGSDIPRIYKTGAYSFPLIPGHEFAGMVESVGEHIDEKWIGKRVGVFPLIPCHTCGPCQKNQFELCRHYSYLGSRRDGGFAEYVAVPVDNLIELPEKVQYEEAAMLEPMAVAVHAMKSMQPQPSDTVAVCGLGTIGLLLCMFLKDAGIKNVLTIGNKEFQKDKVLEMGIDADHYCDSNNQDVDLWIKEKTEQSGVDIFFECVGKNETINQAVSNTAPSGKIQLIGNPASDLSMEKNTYWKILRNQLTVKGSWNSTFLHEPEDDWHYVLERLDQQAIHPGRLITHKYPLDQLEQGFHIMRDKTEEYVKIMSVL